MSDFNRRGWLRTLELFNNADIQRFWRHVEINRFCWTWKLKTFKFEYKGMTTTPSRFSFRLAKGYWPKSQVWRLCGNNLCVNPNHLFAGSYKEFLLEGISYITPEKVHLGLVNEKILNFIKTHTANISGHWLFTLAAGNWKDIFWAMYGGKGEAEVVCGKSGCVRPGHMTNRHTVKDRFDAP